MCACPPGASLPGEVMLRDPPRFGLLPQLCPHPPRAQQWSWGLTKDPKVGVTPSPVTVQGTDRGPQAGGHPVSSSGAGGDSRAGG